MKPSSQTLDKTSLKEDGGKKRLNISKKNLISLDGIDKLLPEAASIFSLDASQNNLLKIDTSIASFERLSELDLSMNHIQIIENLDVLQKLQTLNLSMNRIERVASLIQLKNLRSLDLSMNYIEAVEQLTLPRLQELNLSGNKLKQLPEFENLPKIQHLDVSKNQLKDIDTLAVNQMVFLQRLNVSHNSIEASYMQSLGLVLRDLHQLIELDMAGNPIAEHSHYKYEVLRNRKIDILDGSKLQEYQINKIMSLGKAQNFDEAVEATNAEYINRLKRENYIKSDVKAMLQEQMQQVDDIFDRYQELTLVEQAKFINYIKALESKKRQGIMLDLDEDKLEKWKQMIVENDIEKRKQFEEALYSQQKAREKVLNSAITGTSLRKKLYEVALNEPELWRELKTKELDQIVQEQQQQLQEEHRDFADLREQNQSQERSEYQDFQEQQRQNLGQNIADKLRQLDELSEQDRSKIGNRKK